MCIFFFFYYYFFVDIYITAIGLPCSRVIISMNLHFLSLKYVGYLVICFKIVLGEKRGPNIYVM